MLKLSPTALKAYLACPRSWYLSHILRAPKHVPAYVSNGRALDAAVQQYLIDGTEPHGADGPDATAQELAVTKPELPAPGTVIVQPKLSLPCPGLEGRVQIEGTLDALTPPNAGLMVVIDLKRVWHKDAALSPEALANDVQAQMYAWLVWQLHAPIEVIWRWVYCARASGTRKAKAFTVDVKADRAKVEAWFDSVVLPTAREMLTITGAVESVCHSPESCEDGARCFVRSSCPIHTGPIKQGEQLIMDLNRFKATQLAAGAARVAINPPAMTSAQADAVTVALNGRYPQDGEVEAPSRETDTAANVLDAVTIEGPGAELLESVPDTIPAPPEPVKAPRKHKAKADQDAQRPIAEALRLASENEPIALEDASTEQIRDELLDRGWVATLVRSR